MPLDMISVGNPNKFNWLSKSHQGSKPILGNQSVNPWDYLAF